MNSKTPKVEVSEFVEHIIQKFTLPKYPELKRHHLADWEVRDMRNTIEYICKAQRNACRRMCEHKLKTTHNPILDIILTAEIESEDYE